MNSGLAWLTSALGAAMFLCCMSIQAASVLSYKTCYAKGERAQGAPGFPKVEYLPCCDKSLVQIEDETRGWGKFCLPSLEQEPTSVSGLTPPTGKTCYEDGARAQGAPGKPKVLWLPCCNVDSVQISSERLGWGKFCLPKSSINNPMKCYLTAERCAGAPGHAYIPYNGGCCSETERCVKNEKLGWGRFCSEQY